MTYDTKDKLDRLFVLARSEQPPASAREDHFETRLMARLHEQRRSALPWYLLVWRMIPAFAVIAAISAICSASFNPSRSSDPFAAISSGQEEYLAKSYLTGE